MDKIEMTTYDYIQDAINHLHDVHSSMLNALLESQQGPEDSWIVSSDFAELNALSKKLEALSKRFAPAYHLPSFAELTEAWGKENN